MNGLRQRGYGQAEPSVAAAGRYVVEAWNDSTAFFTRCGSPGYKQEYTGIGFSSDGGRTFTDLGGLPEQQCTQLMSWGDPSVVAYQTGGKTYFYVSSLWGTPVLPNQQQVPFAGLVAVTVCQASGTKLTCGQPVPVGSALGCKSSSPRLFGCDTLDKPFLAIDPLRHRLYATYADFNYPAPSSIFLSVCGLANPAMPVCENNPGVTKPYASIAWAAKNFCENNGAYPAVDPKTGDVYVAFQFGVNAAVTQVCGITRRITITRQVLTRFPYSCLTLTRFARCGPSNRISVAMSDLMVEPIPGYGNYTLDGAPRIAVSDRYGTVTMVWADVRLHPMGDVVLRSFRLGTLTAVQRGPVFLDWPIRGGLNFMPALRMANPNGTLDITWVSRATPTTTLTNVYGAMDVNPLSSVPPKTDIKITSVASDWLNATSDLIPGFGDMSDNYVSGSTLYVAWPDGRLGVVQPFEAHLSA